MLRPKGVLVRKNVGEASDLHLNPLPPTLFLPLLFFCSPQSVTMIICSQEIEIMSFFCRSMTIFAFRVLVLTIAMSNVFASGSREAYHRNFWHPMFHGERLAYCSFTTKECGASVANHYCEMMGYMRSDQQIIAHNVGLSNYIDFPLHCKGWRCNGFKTIRCVSDMVHQPAKAYYYRYRRFVFPRFNHYRVDWCYDGNKKQCGRKVAASFCKRMGYLETKGFAIEQHVAATKAIGNQKLCFGPCCNAFKQITCYR